MLGQEPLSVEQKIAIEYLSTENWISKDLAQKIISTGDINASDNQGQTLLHQIIQKVAQQKINAHIANGLFQVLFQFEKMNLFKIDLEGRTPVKLALDSEQTSLLAHTLLHKLISDGSSSTILAEYVIGGISDINLANPMGTTLLIAAVKAQSPQLVQLLLTYYPEIELHHKDKMGYSALDYAKDQPHIKEVLRSFDHRARKKVRAPEEDQLKSSSRKNYPK